MWEPGDPLMDPYRDDYGYSAGAWMFAVLDDHPRECDGDECYSCSTRPFRWYPGAPVGQKWEDLLAGEPPVTEFYGARVRTPNTVQ